MSSNFRRTRTDTAVGKTFPNAKEIVIARQDVSNKNLLKNPYNNKSDPHDVAGQRPLRRTTDDRGNVFAVTTLNKVSGITNLTLLQNPNRIQEDPIDTPRTLSLQVIKDINSGKVPKYIRENRGIDQIAFMILQFMKDNGVKMATIAMLKSFITGHKLSVLLDKGGQFVTRAFSFFRQLIDSSTKLYRKGLLDISLDDLVTKYSAGLASVYGPVILNEVSHIEISNALKELGALSGVLSRLFRDQNAVEPNKLVPYEQLVGLPPNPTAVVDPNSGDNEPSPPQGIEEPDNIQQEEKKEEEKKEEPVDPATLPDRIIALRQKLGMPIPEYLRAQPTQPAHIVSARQHDGLGLMRDANTVGNFVSGTVRATDTGLSSKIDQGLWGIVDIGRKGVSKLYGAAQRRGTVPVANQPVAGPPLQAINRAPRLVADVQPLQSVIPPGIRVETEQERFNRNVAELASRKAYRDIIAGTYTDFGNEDLDSDELIREREYAEFEALNAELIRRAELTQAGQAVSTKKTKKSPKPQDPVLLQKTEGGKKSIQQFLIDKKRQNLTKPALGLYLLEEFGLGPFTDREIDELSIEADKSSGGNKGLKYAYIEGKAETLLKLKESKLVQQPVQQPKPVQVLQIDPSKSALLDKEQQDRFNLLFGRFEGEGRSKKGKHTKLAKNIDSQILALLKG